MKLPDERRGSNARATQAARVALSKVAVGGSTADIFRALQRAVPIAAGFMDTFGVSGSTDACLSPFALPEGLLDVILHGRQGDAPKVLRGIATLRPGAFLTSRAMMSADRWREVEGYRALARFGIGETSGLKLWSPGVHHSSHLYAALLQEKGAPLLSPADACTVEALTPHLLKAVERARLPLLAHVPILHQIVAEAALGFACIGLSETVLEANPTAHTLSMRYAPAIGVSQRRGRLQAVLGHVLQSRGCPGWDVVQHAQEPSALRVRIHQLRKEVHALAEDVTLVVLDEMTIPSAHPVARATADPLAKLPRRLREVAQALVETSMSIKEIADHLGVTVGTAEKHVERLYHALGVHTRAELVQRLR